MPARGYSVTPRTKRKSAPAPRPSASEQRLARQVAQQRQQVRQGRGPRADTGNVLRGSKVAPGEAKRAQRALRPQQHKLPDRRETSGLDVSLGDLAKGLGAAAGFAGRAGSDLVSLPKNAVVGLYETGAALSEAAQSGSTGLAPVFEAILPGKGSTARGNRLLRGLDDGALGKLLVHGDPVGAAKAFNEHPLFSALEVTGAGQILGRGAGAAARSGVAGGAAKARASSRRAPLRVEGTNQRKVRRYSPNLIVQEGQRAVERAKTRRNIDPNVARGRTRERLLNQEVDEFAAQAEGLRRRGRTEVARAGAKMAPVRTTRGGGAAAVDRARSRSAEASALPGVRGRAERDVVLAAVEGRLRGPRTFRQDLKTERDRLHRVYLAERHEMSAGARQANREQVKALDRVLGDPKALANASEVFRAADEYNAVAGKIESKLIEKGALHPDQADAARLRTYAVAHMGARPRKEGGVVDADGAPITTAQIKAHIAEHGNREPGFVGQRRSDRGARSFFVNWWGSGRKTVDSNRRTGEAARTGAYDASFNALEENLVRGQGVVDALDNFDSFVGRFGSKRRDNKPYTWDEAQRTAGELGEATGMDWVPVRAVPARYDEATRDKILNDQGAASTPAHMDQLAIGRLDDAMKAPEGKERQARNVVLVPAQQVQRFREHQAVGSTTAGKIGQVATRAFRGTVLPFSVRWFAGNAAEATLRSAMHGIGPGDVARGRKVMGELLKLDEIAYRQADTRIRGGLVYGSGDRLNVRRSSQDFAGTRVEGAARAAEFAARLPVVRQTIAGLKTYQRAVFAFNRSLEQLFQSGVIGKQARLDAQELTGSWAKAITMQRDVAQEVAKGLLGTPKQVQYARATDAVLGQYGRFSPSTRRIIQSYSPFLPWALNATKMSFYVLPAKHPVKAALLANIEQTLSGDIAANAKKVPPGSLQSAIRRKDGGLVDLARYTPFGLVTEGLGGVPDLLLPQISGAVSILRGQSWTGRPLKTADGKTGAEVPDAKKLWLAIYSLAEASVPGLQIGRRLQEGGATATDDSTVFAPKTKPGTSRGSAVGRIVNPIRPTYLKGGAKTGTGTSDPAIRDAQRAIRDAQKATGASDAVREAQRALRDARP